METSKILREHGIRPSFTRVSIYDYLKNHRIHPSAEDIHRALSTEIPTLSRTTVYNTLHLLVQKHLVTTLDLEEDQLRYDLPDHPHAHFKCRICGEVFDIDEMPPVSASEDALDGFQVEESKIMYYGVCPSCQKTA
ncbi:MAG: Fur family transcriptional regulator [Candidatus Izemoplasmataceae bacterium]